MILENNMDMKNRRELCVLLVFMDWKYSIIFNVSL